MPPGTIKDPYGSYNFMVEIGSTIVASFQECTGLDSTIDIVEHREGGDSTARKLPGQTKYSNIVLKWGMTDDTELYDWHRRVVEGNIERMDGSIILYDRKMDEEVARWDFDRAWPVSWKGPDFNAESSEVAIETLELAHEGVKRA